ncbi:MAG: transposase [Clostridiales bacterium]|nr:transposase [Clostridiales bacterium]
MPRVARIKNEHGIYHIMVRSISDVPLFKDCADKDKYLQLIKKYQDIYLFKVYAYCLMTTHGHMTIDCCGADISKIMKSINQSYAAYFNKKYNRHGHVFQDRFKSVLVHNYQYLLVLTAYIHNNPKDIKQYRNSVEKYKYSSFGIYLGMSSNTFDIIDTNYILSFFGKNTKKARKTYLSFVRQAPELEEKIDVEFEEEGSECRSERKILIRNISPKEVVQFVSKYTGVDFNIHVKFNRKHSNERSLCVLVMRCLCNFSLKEICHFIGNITISTVSQMCEKGYKLITESNIYRNLLDDMIVEYSAS